VGDEGFVPLFEGPVIGFDSRMTSEPGQSSIHLRALDDTILLRRKKADAKSWPGKKVSEVVKAIFHELDSVDQQALRIEETKEAVDDRTEIMARGNLFDTLIELADLTRRIVYLAPGPEPNKCIAAFKARSDKKSVLPALVLLGRDRNIDAFEVSSDSILASTVVGSALKIDDKAVLERTAQYRDENLMGDDPAIDPKDAADFVIDPYTASTPYVVDAITGKRSDLAHVLRAHGRVRVGCYAGVLSPDMLVPVSGTSKKLAGSYFILAVTHTLTRSEYTQDFEVERAGVSQPETRSGGIPVLF